MHDKHISRALPLSRAGVYHNASIANLLLALPLAHAHRRGCFCCASELSGMLAGVDANLQVSEHICSSVGHVMDRPLLGVFCYWGPVKCHCYWGPVVSSSPHCLRWLLLGP